MSVDVQSLTQKVEFLEFQLEDYQRREAQLKSMYESLLQSFSSPSADAPAQCDCSREKDRLQRELEAGRTEWEAAQQQVRDLDFRLRDQNLEHEQTVLELNKRIVKLEGENKELSWKSKQLAASEARSAKWRNVKSLRPHITKLKTDLSSIKSAWTGDSDALKQLLQESIYCVRDIYEEQLARVKEQLATAQGQLRDKAMDDTDDDRETAAQLKEQLREKTAEVEQLKHTLWQKFAEQRFSCRDCLAQLENKEKQVEDLKRQAGELRIQLSSPTSLRPPSPMHSRTISHSPRPREEVPSPQQLELDELRLLRTYERMVSSCSQMQCGHCAGLWKVGDFHEHILVCRLEKLNNSQTSRRTESFDESRLKELKEKVSQLRSERDRATLEAERLLMQLKSVKLDWALTEERKEERHLQLRSHLKQIVKVLYRARDAVSRNDDLDSALLSLRELTRQKCSYA